MPALLEQIEIGPGFAREWFRTIARRIGDDLANAPYWRAIEVFGKKQPDAALRLLQLCVAGPLDDAAINFAACLLAGLKASEKETSQTGEGP